MFGYIVMNKPEIKFKDFDLYRSFYCGLCRELKSKYGISGQISLTYDMTFVVILLSALHEPHTQKGSTRCIIHPVCKQPVRRNTVTEYAADMNVLESRVFHDITGDEMLLCVDAPAEKIKDLTQQIEERHPYGRLFDMDVIGTDGMKLSRSSYRKCLICDCQAQECARARRHTVAEMQDRIEEILGNSQNPVNLY